MLSLQEGMSSHELDIRQVPTLQNIADLNTKGHSKNRLLALLRMFGFVTSKGIHVGADELAKQQAKETMKKHVKLVGQVLKHGSENSSVGRRSIYRLESNCKACFENPVDMQLDVKLAEADSQFSSSSCVDSARFMSPGPEALGQRQFN